MGRTAHDRLASLGSLRSHEHVLKWLSNRVVVHSVITAIFTIPLFLLSLPSHLDDRNSIYRKTQGLFWIGTEFPKIELAAEDLWIRLGRAAPVHPSIVFIAIDQASTSAYLDSAFDPSEIARSHTLTLMHSRFPYPREVWADVCDRLIGAGAKVVALDVLFPGPSADDNAWKNAIDRYRDHLVIGMNIDFTSDLQNVTASFSLPSSSLLPGENPFDNRLGYVNFFPDLDSVVRSAQYRTNVDALSGNAVAAKEPKFYSFAARAVEKSGHGDLVPDDLSPRMLRYAGWPTSTFLPHSLYKLFDPHAWEIDFKNGEFFRDKIVVVGPQGDFVKDKSPSPYGPMDGSEIHLNAINALLQNEFIHRMPLAFLLSAIVLSGLLALTLTLVLTGIGWRFLAGLGILSTYLIILVWAYDNLGWLLPTAGPLGVFCGSMGTGFIYDFVLTQIEKLRLRATFERYYPPKVVSYLLEHTDAVEKMLAGARRPVTVLFSDIRDFTSIVETTADSQQLVDKLNEYFSAMVDCIYRHDGSLDKFMGDGVMAIWGNIPMKTEPEEDAANGVRAALDMIVALRELNAKWRAEGKTEWRVGIGLNHGQVIVGDMGSQKAKNFGVVGDAINLGSRLEGLTKEYRLPIIIGERVAELVRDKFHLRSVDVVKVKGKSQAVQAFTVLGEKSEALSPEQKKFLSLYEEGISAFRRREFDRALELFQQALALQPEDRLAADYVASSRKFIATPPDAAWTGIRIMTDK